MTVVDLYTIQIIETSPDSALLLGHEVDEMMSEMQENLTDLLPEGFQAVVLRWNHPDPDEEHKWQDSVLRGLPPDPDEGNDDE